MSSVSFSVITATWNSSSTLVPCIESVNKQTWLDVEHVFVDGASTDNTLSLIRAHSCRPHRCVSERDRGIYDALNKGIALAGGDVIGFLHSDDTLADSAVLARIAHAFEDPTVDAVYGDLDYVDRADRSKVIRRWRSQPFKPSLLKDGWMPAHPTLYVRAEVYRRIGHFDVNYRISADYLSVLQMFSQPSFKAAYLDSVLVKMCTGGISNRSIKTIARKSAEDLKALRRTGVGGIDTLIRKNLSKITQFL